MANKIDRTVVTDGIGKPVYPGIVGVNTFNDQTTFTPEGDIDLAPGTAAKLAFLVPRGGAITDLAARFYMTQELTLTGTTGTVTVQFYQSATSDNNLFKQIGIVTLEPELNPGESPYQPGKVLSVTKNDLDVKVDPGSRVILAFEAHASGDNPEITLTGHANASIGIS